MITPVPMIDAHQHYWAVARGDYFWMSPETTPTLYRDFGPAELEPLLARRGIGRTVLVQAAATIAETDYMLSLADATPSVAAVVGWIDFEQPDHRRHLERFARHPKFRGVRPMIQDIADVDWMLRPDLAWAFDALADLDLHFEALGFPRHLDNFLTLFLRHPRLRVIVDHGMKPEIRHHDAGRFKHWAGGMARLAGETGAWCKLSGLATEAAPGWTVADLAPYAAQVIESFGADRVVWGSDWPVVTLNGDYDRWLDTAQALTGALSPGQRDAVFGGNAQRFYRLGG